MLPIIALLFAFATLSLGEGENNFEIVGGQEAQKHEFPFIVGLQFNRRHTCGASIINENWLLTAAHCMQRERTNYQAIAGDHDNSDTRNDGTEQVRLLAEIINHPKYNADTMEYDFSMLRLSQPLSFSNRGIVGPTSYPPERWNSTSFSNRAVVAGWGAIVENGPSTPKLQKVSVPQVSQANCRSAYGRYNMRITDAHLCAGEAGKDSCQGDSGGPLICQSNSRGSFTLCGVVSYGIGCAREGHPGVYARTSHVASWIRDISGTRSGW